MHMQGEDISTQERGQSTSQVTSRRLAPVARATVVIGTIVALVASVGAPFKWY